MKQDNERVEFIDAQPGRKEPRKNGGVKDVLNGNVLSRESVSGQIPYILFLAFIALLYIGNRYRYDKMVRQGQELHVEVSNLRAEYITTAAQLMHVSRQSQVSRMVREKGLGLEESTVPPKRLRR